MRCLAHEVQNHGAVEVHLHRGLVDGGTCSAKQRARLPSSTRRPTSSSTRRAALWMALT
jgi:hypothetical protein